MNTKYYNQMPQLWEKVGTIAVIKLHIGFLVTKPFGNSGKSDILWFSFFYSFIFGKEISVN